MYRLLVVVITFMTIITTIFYYYYYIFLLIWMISNKICFDARSLISFFFPFEENHCVVEQSFKQSHWYTNNVSLSGLSSSLQQGPSKLGIVSLFLITMWAQ